MKALILESSRYFKTDLLRKNRDAELVRKRNMVIAVLRELGNTLKSIGEEFGKDHTTILNSLNRHSESLEFANFVYNREYIKEFEKYREHILMYNNNLHGDILPIHRVLANAIQGIGIDSAPVVERILFRGVDDKELLKAYHYTIENFERIMLTQKKSLSL